MTGNNLGYGEREGAVSSRMEPPFSSSVVKGESDVRSEGFIRDYVPTFPLSVHELFIEKAERHGSQALFTCFWEFICQS
jgi:hypothetical protein